MSTQMKFPSSIIFVAALLVVIPTLVSAEWNLPKKGTVNLEGFLVVACAQTFYPETCYNSLSPFVATTAKEPGRLALIALGETVKETQEFTALLKSLSGSVPGPTKVVIDGFLESLVENTAKIQGSLAKLQKVVGSEPGQGFDDTLVDIETHTRAAVLSVSAWADKIKALGNSAAENEIRRGIESLKYGTTNAWNLVVFYFNDETSPTFS